MQLRIGGLQTPHDMIVADIKDECILGTDFLKPHQCVVDLKNSVLPIGSEQVPLLKPSRTTTPTCCKVTLGDSVDLPAMSETVACARVLDRPSSMVWGVLEPDDVTQTKSLDGLLVGRALVDLSAEAVPVRLLNLTDQPRRIKQGTQVAICNAVELSLIHI